MPSASTTHVPRQALASCLRLKCRNERLEHERRLTRTRNARYRDKAAARDINLERLDGMDGIGCHADMSLVEHFVVSHLRTQALELGAQKRRDTAALRLLDLVYRTSGDYTAAACSGNGAHLDQIVASASTRVSWSTTTTVLPSSTRSRITPTKPSTLAGCKPIEGSSST